MKKPTEERIAMRREKLLAKRKRQRRKLALNASAISAVKAPERRLQKLIDQYKRKAETVKVVDGIQVRHHNHNAGARMA